MTLSGHNVTHISQMGSVQSNNNSGITQAKTEVYDSKIHKKNNPHDSNEVIGQYNSGALIGGRYTVIKKLGQGGFGATYLAEHKGLGDKVVLKELLVNSEKHMELFKREAKMLRKLKIQGIPNVADYFEHDNKLYLVQDYIDGKDLRHILDEKTEKKISEDQAIWLLSEMLKVLKDLHAKKMIHRDIKPDNIMIKGDFFSGEVYLIDFGGVKEATDEVLSGETSTHLFTPGYAAFEQTMGKVGYESDIYSLGMTVAEALTGVPATDLRNGLEEIDFSKFNIKSKELRHSLEIMTKHDREERVKKEEDIIEIIEKNVKIRRRKVSKKKKRKNKGGFFKFVGKTFLFLIFCGLLVVGGMHLHFRGYFRLFTTLKITSTPNGAEIYNKDGVLLGKTPYKKYIRPGSYEYIVKQAGAYDVNFKIDVADLNKIHHAKINFNWSKIGNIEMVRIEKGQFSMGNPNYNSSQAQDYPSHNVNVKMFYISRTEVTQKLFQDVMGYNPSEFKGPDKPVEKVSWYDAVQFCNELSAKNNLPNYYSISSSTVDSMNQNFQDSKRWFVERNYNSGFRLPTEAEWEYAARAGTDKKYYWGDNINYFVQNANLADKAMFNIFRPLNDYGYFQEDSTIENYVNFTYEDVINNYTDKQMQTALSDNNPTTSNVASYKSNQWGLFDVIGNVYEWCWDWFAAYQSKSVDNPFGPAKGSFKIIRGGSFKDLPDRITIFSRNYAPADAISNRIGFRVVKEHTEELDLEHISDIKKADWFIDYFLKIINKYL